MDWFINKEDELYIDDSSNSLSYDPTFDIENVFNKQNSFGDYEVKIDDFVLDKSNTNTNSKLPSPDYRIFETIRKETIKDTNTETNTSIISDKNKDGKKGGKQVVKSKDKTIKKEDLSRHPFLVSKADSANKETNRKPTLQENSTLPAKSSISQINQNSTASIDENSESLNKSFDSSSKQNLKIDSLGNKNNSNQLSKSPDDYISIDNFYINDENNMERTSEIADCNSLINNNSYSIYGHNQNNFVNGKLFDYRVGMKMNNSDYEKMKNQNCMECLNNMNNNNHTLNPNVAYYHSLQNLSLSGRMKIKREKTKMLLEKKTKRENFGYNLANDLNSDNFAPNKELNPIICQNFNNIQNKSELNENINFNSNDEFSNSFSYLNTNVASFNSSRLTKKELKMLRNRISAQRSRDRKKKEMDELKVISQNLFNENYYLKKELENKDKEISQIKEKLKLICKNCDNVIKTSEINKENISQPSNYQVNSQNQNCSRQRVSLVDLSRRNFSNSLKYSLMTGFLVVVCLIGTLAWQSITSNKDSNNLINSNFNPTGRVLFSNNENVGNSNMVNLDLMDGNKNLNDSSTGIILYQNKSTRNENKMNTWNNLELKSDKSDVINIDYPPAVKKQKNIFEISKDFEKYKEMQKKSTVSTISNSKENFFISGKNDLMENDEDEMRDLNLPLNFETALLEKKRFEFFIKMQNRKRRNLGSNTFIPNRGFLRKEKEISIDDNNICVNTDDLSWSIQEEIELHENEDLDVLKSNQNLNKKNSNAQIENYSSHRGIIVKTNNNINYNLDNISLLNQVVPLNDNRFNYESSLLKKNIKSMYCRDFMTPTEENGEIFKNLFEKLKLKESEQSVKYFNYDKNSSQTQNKSDDDCLYLHMIVPAISQDQDRILGDKFDISSKSFNEEEESSNNYSSEKKVFYEVGCKIFEINKIYK